MATTGQLTAAQSEPFVFFVPLAPIRRTVSLVATCIFLALVVALIWLYIDKGPARSPDSMLALCCTAVVPLLVSAFFLWLSFPPSRSLAKLEFCRNGINYTPARVDRLMHDSVRLTIQPDSREILIRYRYAKYSLLIRTASGRDCETGVSLLTELSADDGRELVNGIVAATGLPARIVTEHQLPNGEIESLPWRPRSAMAKWATLGKMVFGTLPLWGGAMAGSLTSSFMIIAMVGLALWLAQSLALVVHTRIWAKGATFPWLYWLSTVFTFGAGYTAVAVFVSFELRPH